jgi:hypothetical protein
MITCRAQGFMENVKVPSGAWYAVGIVKLLREILDECRFTSFRLYDKRINSINR